MKRLYLIALCICITTAVTAQYKSRKSNKKSAASIAYNKKAKEDEKFLQKQWWLGLKAGTNLSKANVTTIYSVLSPTNYDPTLLNKEYESFKQLGVQTTLEVTFYFRQLSLSFQPTYRRSRFVYANSFVWLDNETSQNTLELEYEQEQRMDHVILPLLIKFDFTTTKLRPYLQAGAFSAILVNANKSVTITGTDYASGGTNEFESEPIIVGAKDLFAKNHWGLMGGAGLNYHQGNVRINLDIVYLHGMSNISSTENRYGNDRLSGVGDALDDMTLDNLAISLGCLFPLRFLESGFKSLDKK